MALNVDSYIADSNGNNRVADLSLTVNDLLENGTLQFGQLVDSSSVYATFNPQKYPNLLLGSQIATYQITLAEDSGNEINIENVAFTINQPISVNLRYVYGYANSNSIDGAVIINWDMDDNEKSLYYQSAHNPNIFYTFAAPFEQTINYYSNQSYDYSTLNYRYFLDLDRTELMYIFSCTFCYIDDNHLIKNINIPDSDVITHLKSNDENFIYNGHTVYPYVISIRTVFPRNNYEWISGNRTALSQGVFPYFCVERYAGNKLIQINTGIHTSFNQRQIQPFSHSGFTVNWKSFKTYSNSIYNGRGTNTSSFAYSALPDGNEEMTYLTGITPYTSDTDSIDFTDDIFTNYNPGQYEFLTEVYQRGNFFYILDNTTRSSIERASRTLTISPVITLKDICRQFGLTLIPFCYGNQFLSYPTSSDYVLIGIRNSDGSVYGDYEEYDWDNPQTEKQFRPDDFTPLVPSPEIPETEDEGNTRSGSSIALRAPTNLAGCAGFVTNYCLTNDQMQRFGSALWASFTDSAFWQSLATVFTDSLSINPSDILKYIISLRCFPIDLISGGISTTDKFYIGRGTVGIDLGSSVAYTTDMTIFKSCGTIAIPEYNHNYRDYSPYRTISIYLPFCGEFELNATDVSGSVLTVHYAIDLTTGICTAFVLSSYQNIEYPVLTVSGQMGQDIQLTAGNLSPVAVSLARAVISGVSGEISGGIQQLESASTLQTIGGAIVGGVNGFSNHLQSGLTPGHCNPGASFNAFYAPMTPYVKIKSSKIQKPSNFSNTQGNIALQSRFLNELSGFVQVVNPDCSGIPATEMELNQIRQLLENGVHV